MTLDSSDVLFFTLAFLVPGFILQWTLSAFVSQRKEDAQLLLLRYLTLSCANYGLWSGVVFLIFLTDLPKNNPVLSAVAFFLIVFVSPVVIGLALGKSNQNDTIRRLLSKVGFRPIHVVPVGWDYKFSHIREAAWIIVTLTDNSQIAGFWGERSFASSEAEERDLYIEEVWIISEDGDWKPQDRSEGVLICSAQIKYIEFRTYVKEKSNGVRT